MNYHNIYDLLISKAQYRVVEGYVERHHIIPKSLGGSNKKHNRVCLTAREHYIAHRLLVKMYAHHPDRQAYKKMVYAMWFLSKTLIDQRKVSSRAYENARQAFSVCNPQKDEDRKALFREKHKAGDYNYDYEQVSVTLSNTLANMSASDMAARMAPAHNCDHIKRAEAIKRGKSSLLRVTYPDGTTADFHSYDDVRGVTGKSYDSVRLAIRTNNGLLVNGNRVEYIQKYEGKNQWS